MDGPHDLPCVILFVSEPMGKNTFAFMQSDGHSSGNGAHAKKVLTSRLHPSKLREGV